MDTSNLHSAVCTYARNLSSALRSHLGILTSYGMIDRSLYVKATLGEYEQESISDWASQKRIESPATQPENAILTNWRKSGFRDPLLVVAVAGSGKSCLIESFALSLSEDLISGEGTCDDSQVSAVPLIISLAKAGRSKLEDYIKLAECEITGAPQSLTPEILNHLRHDRRLVLLIDGFDELPGEQERLVGEIPRLQCPFVLTSRPGNGERRVVGNTDRHLCLQNVTFEEAFLYTERYFTLRHCKKVTPRRAASLFVEDWTSGAADLLSRPLFLKVWCDSLHDSLRPPLSLSQFGSQLLMTSFKTKGLMDDVGHIKRVEISNSFVDWFGSLGIEFAKNDFRPMTYAELPAPNMISKDSLTKTPLNVDFFDVACRAGLLIYSDSSVTYILPKSPLAEYVIGTAIANDVSTNPDRPEVLIEAFRSWACKPYLFTILDYVFDALWNGDFRSQEWADALLEWAGQNRAEQAGNRETSQNQDIARPTVLPALRWIGLRLRWTPLSRPENEFY